MYTYARHRRTRFLRAIEGRERAEAVFWSGHLNVLAYVYKIWTVHFVWDVWFGFPSKNGIIF